MGEIERQKRGHILSSFIANYKPQYYYWECIIFLRRICIAMFSVSATDNNYTICFILIMYIFLFCQYRYQPFIIHSVNTMEFILLSCISFVIVLESISFINYTLKHVLISFLIIFPFILFFYFIIKYQKINISKNQNDSSDDDLLLIETELHFENMAMAKITSDYYIMDDKYDER